jgi:hypothetical protein
MARQTTRAAQIHPREAEGRPLQYADLDSVGKQIARQNFANIGNVKSNLGAAMATEQKAAANEKNSPAHRLGAERTLANLAAVADIGVTDKPLSIRSAGSRRMIWANKAAKRAEMEGDIRRTTDPGLTRSGLPGGVGWYLDHADDIDRAARAYGQHTPTAITASGAMSPQNEPEQEKAAVAAIMRGQMHNPSFVAKTPEGAKAMGMDNPGDSRAFRDMTGKQVKDASRTSMREHIETPAMLHDLAKGSTELPRGVDVMRGDVSRSEIGAGTGKVPSYLTNIHDAYAADANTRGEYFRRAHEAFSSKPYFEQPTVFGPEWEADPYGKASSTEGILNPTGNTAEDTWMQAMSLGQKNEDRSLPTGKGSGRLAKVLGSHAVIQSMSVQGTVNGKHETAMPTPVGSKKVTGDELRHAMNNAATIDAASRMSDEARARGRNVGAGIPAMMVQETAWTEYRIDQGKDPLYTKAMKDQGTPGFKDGKVYNPDRPLSTEKTDTVLKNNLPGKWVQDRLL